MRGKLQAAAVVIITLMLSTDLKAADNWKAPFDTTATNIETTDSVLSLNDVLTFVAKKNPIFQSYNSFFLQARNSFLICSLQKYQVSTDIQV